MSDPQNAGVPFSTTNKGGIGYFAKETPICVCVCVCFIGLTAHSGHSRSTLFLVSMVINPFQKDFGPRFGVLHVPRPPCSWPTKAWTCHFSGFPSSMVIPCSELLMKASMSNALGQRIPGSRARVPSPVTSQTHPRRHRRRAVFGRRGDGASRGLQADKNLIAVRSHAWRASLGGSTTANHPVQLSF